MGMGIEVRHRMAKRAAKEIQPGMVVNLGIGIPSLIPNYLPSTEGILFQAENGILGMGPSPIKGEEDAHLCNAAGFPVTLLPGGSYFDSSIAFGIIRKGKIDITVLGALQVSQKGDLANWIVPGKRVPGIGGAVELAAKAKKVVVVMSHTSKDGQSKIVANCTLPLTAKKCVDLIITEKAVFRCTSKGLELIEIYADVTLEELKETTKAPFVISHSLKKLGEGEVGESQ
jgi:acetate CoA/acetoacetate CoA-transferase beta subunit